MDDRLGDAEVAAVLTFIRTSWGNDAPVITPEQIAAVRRHEPSSGVWQATDLRNATGIPSTKRSHDAP